MADLKTIERQEQVLLRWLDRANQDVAGFPENAGYLILLYAQREGQNHPWRLSPSPHSASPPGRAASPRLCALEDKSPMRAVDAPEFSQNRLHVRSKASRAFSAASVRATGAVTAQDGVRCWRVRVKAHCDNEDPWWFLGLVPHHEWLWMSCTEMLRGATGLCTSGDHILYNVGDTGPLRAPRGMSLFCGVAIVDMKVDFAADTVAFARTDGLTCTELVIPLNHGRRKKKNNKATNAPRSSRPHLRDMRRHLKPWLHQEHQRPEHSSVQPNTEEHDERSSKSYAPHVACFDQGMSFQIAEIDPSNFGDASVVVGFRM